MKAEYSIVNKVSKSIKEEDCTHITPNSIFMDSEMSRAKERFQRPPYYLQVK